MFVCVFASIIAHFCLYSWWAADIEQDEAQHEYPFNKEKEREKLQNAAKLESMQALRDNN